MRKERVNINLDNKRIGLVKNEDNLPKATVSLSVNGHNLKFAIGNQLEDKYFPPAPPNNCNGIVDAASYAALVKSSETCGATDTFSQVKVDNLETLLGIKVQGSPLSELKIENVVIEDLYNLDILNLLIGDQEIDLLGNLSNLNLELNSDGLDLLIVQAIQNGFLIGDLDGNNSVNAMDALQALKAAVGLVDVNHVNKTVAGDLEVYKRFEATHKFLEENFSFPIERDENGNFKITASVALALLQIAVQYTNNNFIDDKMPPNSELQ